MTALLRGITSNHKEYFYCLNCFHSYSTKNKIKKHEKVCNDHDYCYVEMSAEHNKILKYNHGEKSMKAPFIIDADLECLLEKMHSCRNNSEKSYAEKKTKQTPSGYSLFTNCLFDSTENKLHCYKGKDCMERFKVCYVCKKEFSDDDAGDDDDDDDDDDGDDDDNKKFQKERDHCHYTGKYRGAAHNICNLTYKTPKEIPAVFHNGSTYDYHFKIKQLAKEFDGQSKCLGENTEKYITFSVPIKKSLIMVKQLRTN